MARAHDPRCPVDVDPDRTGPGQQCPTGVDPDPDADRGILRPDLFAEQALRRQGAPQGVGRTVEEHEERIALRIDLATSEAREAAAQEFVVQVQDVGVAILEALEESGGALDIGEQERDRVTRDGRPRVRVRGSCRRHLGALSHRVGLVPWIDPVAGLCASSVLVTAGLVVGARSRCVTQVLVLGDREAEARTATVRRRGAEKACPAGDARLG